MSIVGALILGIVQGISEFLPISSTGHLILVSRLLDILQTEFVKTFQVAIQLGSILAVVVLYWKRFLSSAEVLKKVFVAFLPTAAIGFALYKFIKKFLMGNGHVVVWSLFLGGLLLILFELLHREKKDAVKDIPSISYGQAAFIGVFQAVSVVPGISRSAATIIGGLMLGLRRDVIVEFSFLLAVPTMLAATALDMYKSAGAFNGGQFTVLGIGFAMSFVAAIIGIRFLISFVKRHSFIPFGVYRIILAAVFWFIV